MGDITGINIVILIAVLYSLGPLATVVCSADSGYMSSYSSAGKQLIRNNPNALCVSSASLGETKISFPDESPGRPLNAYGPSAFPSSCHWIPCQMTLGFSAKA